VKAISEIAPAGSPLAQKLAQLDPARMPRHVAMIMDGNGRWAKQRGKERSVGHYKGVDSVRMATELSSDLGIGYLTLYAFSTENWNRPKEEVDILMHLIGMAIEQEMPDMVRNNVHLRLIGEIGSMPAEAYKRLDRCRRATAHCTGLTMTLALSYSGRWEILEAARKLAAMAVAGEIAADEIDDVLFCRALSTDGMPDPDLLIRTGGDERISNYLLWQIAYSELYFTHTLWPDFGKEQYADALIDFQKRERRFGKTSEQVCGKV